MVKWTLPVCALVGAALLSLGITRFVVKPSPFLTATSPGGTYAVSLTGSKERPYFFTNTVRFSVLKNGEPFLADKYLHSGDAFDPSFGADYPQHRWVQENVAQFYREESFNTGTADRLVVVNRAGEVVKYLRLQAVDKFLLFDLQPGATVTLSTSPSRGDLKWVEAEGEFAHGRKIERRGDDFKIRKGLGGPFTFYIYLHENGAVMESPQLEKYAGD